MSQDTLGLGPVLMGRVRLRPGRALRWKASVIFGADSDTADYTLRTVLEYEF
jgi:hypothetical protein